MSLSDRISKSSTNQPSNPVQRVQQPGRVQVDNRPTAAMQRKLQTNINESLQLKSATRTMQLKGGKKGGKKQGTFIGVAGAHHIHEIGGGAHYKYHNSDPVQFNHGGRINRDGVLRAIEECNQQLLQTGDNTGYQACIDYLNGLLVDLPEEVVVATPSPKPGPKPPKRDPKPGSKRPDKYANFNGGSEYDVYSF